MKHRVLVLTTTYPRWKNDSTPRFVHDLSERLGRSHHITVLAPHHHGARKSEQLEHLAIKRFSYFWPKKLQKLCYGGGIIPNMRSSILAKLQMPFLIESQWFAAIDLTHKYNCNLIHAHWLLPSGFIALSLKKKYNIPYIITIHGSDLFSLKGSFFQNLKEQIIKHASFVTVNSKITLDEAKKKFPSYSSKFVQIPMGIDISWFKNKKRVTGKNKTILFVGRLSEQKGIHYLLKALPKIVQQYPNIKLKIVGDGPIKNKLKKQCQHLQLTKNVSFLGALSHIDVKKQYLKADVFVLPSITHKTGTEAQGLSMIEAMAARCPVVATNSGAMKTIITNNKHGMLVQEKSSDAIATAILKIISNKKRSIVLSNNAYKKAEEFSWDYSTEKFLEIYKKVYK